MANDILQGLTGTPPNIPTNYWTLKDGEKATLNEKLLSVNKLNPKPTPIEIVGAMKTYIVNEDIVSTPIPIYSMDNNSLIEMNTKTKTFLFFKKGDKVQSNTISNGGITVPPTTIPKEAPWYKMVFIPLSKLTEVIEPKNDTSNNSNVIAVDKNQLFKYALIGAILYIVFIK